MKMRLIAGLCGCALFFAAGSTIAQQENHPYLTLEGGANFAESAQANSLESFIPGSSQFKFDPGYRVDLNAGYLLKQGALINAFNSNISLDIAAELDLGVLCNPGTLEGPAGFAPSRTDVDYYQLPFIANLVFRVPVTERLHLDIGGGIGGAVGMMNSASTETDVALAYQAVVRLGYDLSDHVTLNAFYKFLGTTDMTFHGDLQTRMDGALNNAFGVGLTWVF